MFRTARILSAPPSAFAAPSTMDRADAAWACPVSRAPMSISTAAVIAPAIATIRFDMPRLVFNGNSAPSSHLHGAAGEVVALGDVIGAELLHPCDAALDHLLDLVAGHRRHVDGYV